MEIQTTARRHAADRRCSRISTTVVCAMQNGVVDVGITAVVLADQVIFHKTAAMRASQITETAACHMRACQSHAR